MKRYVSRLVLLSLTLAAVLNQDGFTQNLNVSEAEAKMFAASTGYERFMGRWSRLLAPAYIAFAGVKNGDRVLDVGTGTGSLASAVEASMPASEIVGIDPSEGFIAYARKNASPACTLKWACAGLVQRRIIRQYVSVACLNFIPITTRRSPKCVVYRAQGVVSACLGLRRRHADASIFLGRSRCARSAN
jgi:SAM-dependent methyltransferase